jgi:hypothetical protein
MKGNHLLLTHHRATKTNMQQQAQRWQKNLTTTTADSSPWQWLVPHTGVLARHHDIVKGHTVSSCVAIVATALDTDDARNEVDHVQEDELMQARKSAKPCSANTGF